MSAESNMAETTSNYNFGQYIHGAIENRPAVRIYLTDNGPCIHQQLWENIFALGFTTRSDGSGLGLYIARSLIESYGGSIRIDHSIVPLETTFLVELPVIEMEKLIP